MLNNILEKIKEDKGFIIEFDTIDDYINGLIKNNNKVTITINNITTEPLLFVLVHEITHTFKLNKLKVLIIKYLKKTLKIKTNIEINELSDELICDIAGILLNDELLFIELLNNSINKYKGINKRKKFISDFIKLWNLSYTEDVYLDDTEYSQKLNGYYPNIKVNTKDISKYNIKNINDLTEVQDKIYNYFKNKYISSEQCFKPIINIDTGMKIEIWKNGIYETFGNKSYYKNLSQNEKKLKLASMLYLAKMIKYAEIRANSASNYHNPKSNLKYHYFKHPIFIDNKLYLAKIDIRKAPNINGRYYIHSIAI